jgi:hypothetical protein
MDRDLPRQKLEALIDSVAEGMRANQEEQAAMARIEAEMARLRTKLDSDDFWLRAL